MKPIIHTQGHESAPGEDVRDGCYWDWLVVVGGGVSGPPLENEIF